MKLTFNIDYRTNWGETLFLTGDLPELGGGDYAKAVKMTLDGVEHWSATIEVPGTAAPFNYRYVVRRDDGSCKDEWGRGNTFAGTDAAEVDIYDRWQDQPFDKPFYSAAFTECIFRHNDTDKAVIPAAGYITICVTAPMIGEGRKVAILSMAIGASS